MTIKCKMIERVRRHVLEIPKKPAFVFYRRYDSDGQRLSWEDLWQKSEQIARSLPVGRDPATTGILLFCDDEQNFVTSLLAVWMVGAVAIPATGGFNANSSDRNRHIIECGKPDIVLHDLPSDKVSSLKDLAPDATFVAVSEQPLDLDAATSPKIKGGMARILQFTSGSTSQPKPIFLDADTIAAGCAAIETTYGLGRNSVGIHWLPLYHDMGLVGGVMGPLWMGGTSVLLRPGIFIQKPSRWFELASEWRAVITSAPNFAYERLRTCLDDIQTEAFDLSCLKSVIFGGEPVLRSTVNALLEGYGPLGLSPDAIAPSYGLAEATLLVSSGQLVQGPVYSSRHTASPVVCLGPPVSGLSVTIRDVSTQRICAEGELGEIWLDGHSIGHVVASGEDWRIRTRKSPIRTGDLGFLEDTKIYITGRTSNKIIIRGKNVYAEDVETITLASQSQGFSSGAAAFGLVKNGTETLCILVEQANKTESFDILSLNQQLSATLGIKPEAVIILRRFSLPRTSSGKVKRAEARESFLAGKLEKKVISYAR